MAELRNQQASGVSVQVLGEGALKGMASHGRMMLVDDGRAVIGSISLAPASLNDRREVAVVIRDPENIGRLRGLFETMARQLPEGIARLTEFGAPGQPGEDEADLD